MAVTRTGRPVERGQTDSPRRAVRTQVALGSCAANASRAAVRKSPGGQPSALMAAWRVSAPAE
eukprot:2444380-Alexandrium_andersonii.AAC.1